MIEIDQALLTHFIAAGLGLDIAHENTDYTPTAGTPYAEVIVLQNDATPGTLRHSNDTDGVLRVLLNYPIYTGAVTAKRKADDIFSAFPIGLRLTYGTTTITINSNHRQPGVPENGWYRLVLTIGYKAAIAR